MTVIEPGDFAPRGMNTLKRVLAAILDPNRRPEPTRMGRTLAQTSDAIDLELPLLVRPADLRRHRDERFQMRTPPRSRTGPARRRGGRAPAQTTAAESTVGWPTPHRPLSCGTDVTTAHGCVPS